jgi:hypothetical protein
MKFHRQGFQNPVAHDKNARRFTSKKVETEVVRIVETTTAISTIMNDRLGRKADSCPKIL